MSFLFKYHMTMEIFCMKLFRGCFAIGPILLLKQQFSHFNLQSQGSFEVREIILWALWLPLAKVNFILRTMASNTPIPGNGWFCQTLFFCLELPQNCLKSHNFKKVGGFETTRLWELLDQKLVFLAIIYLYDMNSYLKLPFRNPHHVSGSTLICDTFIK